MNLEPGGVISWLVVGLISGWLAGLLMKGRGYWMIWDIVLGLVGAFVGGLVFSMFVTGTTGFWGSIAVSFVGACLCIALIRAIAPARRDSALGFRNRN